MKEVSIVMPTTIEEWERVSELIRRDTPMKGKPTGKYNECPVCRKLVDRKEPFCGYCGQRVEFVDPDNIPFEEMV